MLGEILPDKEAKNSSPAATKNKQKTTISVDESNDSQFNSNKSKEFEKGGKKKVKITINYPVKQNIKRLNLNLKL